MKLARGRKTAGRNIALTQIRGRRREPINAKNSTMHGLRVAPRASDALLLALPHPPRVPAQYLLLMLPFTACFRGMRAQLHHPNRSAPQSKALATGFTASCLGPGSLSA